ncbi:MAG: dihydroneopterin aldolase [Bacteroidetes bacterium]|nr:dihydroneopterin aldolase [Bacteroidota bacterium]
MQQLIISGIETHSYHGCLPEERVLGTLYSVDICFTGNFTSAMESDDLSKAVDYVKVSEIVRDEMKIPSNLIEHVGGRILKSLCSTFPGCDKIKVSVSKKQPPSHVYFKSAVFEVEG